ncbi:MAG: hypothetical protein Kow0068_16030 [Marinilabiliales bacterium]
MNILSNKFISHILKNIKFWIIFAFIIRLYGITNPPLETSHNWRQSDVTMVARNFYEKDANIFLPRIDIAGEKTGITGMEFPLFNYLIYLVSLVFGYDHWYGRLINLIFSSIGIFYYYKIIKKYFCEKLAFYSSFILIFSLWFAFSRKIMPDTFSFSLSLIGLYYGSNYLETKKIIHLFYYFIFILTGFLSKIPSAYILIFFIPLFIDKHIAIKEKIVLTITTVIALVPVFTWYFYYVPYLVIKYDFWHFFMGKDISTGIKEILQNMPDALKRFYENALKFIGFVLFIIGLIYAIKNKNQKIITVFVLGFIGFGIIILKSGFNFTHHDYYILPFVPVMALVAAYTLTLIKQKQIILIFLIAIMIECIGNYQHEFRLNTNLDLLSLENDLDKISKPSDLILINSGPYPTPMYFAHRKGWVENNEKITDTVYINSLKAKGLKYIVVLKRCFNKEVVLNYPVIFQNEKYCFYKI